MQETTNKALFSLGQLVANTRRSGFSSQSRANPARLSLEARMRRLGRHRQRRPEGERTRPQTRLSASQQLPHQRGRNDADGIAGEVYSGRRTHLIDRRYGGVAVSTNQSRPVRGSARTEWIAGHRYPRSFEGISSPPSGQDYFGGDSRPGVRPPANSEHRPRRSLCGASPRRVTSSRMAPTIKAIRSTSAGRSGRLSSIDRRRAQAPRLFR